MERLFRALLDAGVLIHTTGRLPLDAHGRARDRGDRGGRRAGARQRRSRLTAVVGHRSPAPCRPRRPLRSDPGLARPSRGRSSTALAAAATGLLIFFLWPRLGLPPRGLPLDAPFPGAGGGSSPWLPPCFSRSRCFMSASSDGPRGAGPRSRRGAGRGTVGARSCCSSSPDGGMAADRPGASRSPCSSWGALRQGFGAVLVAYRAWVAAWTRGRRPGPRGHLRRRARADRRGPRDPSGRPEALPPGRPAAGPCLFWIAFLFYAFLAAYVTTALDGRWLLPAQYAESLRRPGPRDPEQRRGPGLRALLLGPRKPGDVDIGFPRSCCPGTRSARSCPGIRSAVASARPSPSASAPLLGVHLPVVSGPRHLAGRRLLGVGRGRAHAAGPGQPGHVYPEVPGALATVVGARALLRLPHGAGRAGDRDRLGRGAGRAQGPLRAREPRAPRVGRSPARGRRALALGVLAAVTVAGAVVLVWNPMPRVFQNVRGAALLWSVLRAWNEGCRAGLGSSPTRSSAFSTMGPTGCSPRPVSSSCGAGAARP